MMEPTLPVVKSAITTVAALGFILKFPPGGAPRLHLAEAVVKMLVSHRVGMYAGVYSEAIQIVSLPGGRIHHDHLFLSFVLV